MGEIIPDGVVLDGTIVPEGNTARFPAKTDLKLRLFNMPEQKLQQGIAFCLRHIIDARGKDAIDK